MTTIKGKSLWFSSKGLKTIEVCSSPVYISDGLVLNSGRILSLNAKSHVDIPTA